MADTKTTAHKIYQPDTDPIKSELFMERIVVHASQIEKYPEPITVIYDLQSYPAQGPFCQEQPNILLPDDRVPIYFRRPNTENLFCDK